MLQYDPPQRILDNISAASLRPVYTCAEGDPLAWDARFANNADGCGPQNLDAWCGTMPANESELARRCYQGSIAFIDEWIGQIFDALETTGQLNNTWMIWTADHGDGQSDHFHWRKGFPYEFASHVPFMIRWPEGTTDSRASSWVRGSVIGQHVVELRDIFPTFLDAAGSLDVVPSDYKVKMRVLHTLLVNTGLTLFRTFRWMATLCFVFSVESLGQTGVLAVVEPGVLGSIWNTLRCTMKQCTGTRSLMEK